MRLVFWCIAALFGLGLPISAGEIPARPLAVTVRNIDGEEIDLAKKYRDKVCLIVNVASKCGLTPQYEQLEALHQKYREKGFAVLAFPCNDFDGEEPGTNAEIKAFCTSRFGVTFDLFEKVSVQGEKKAPLYRFLTSEKENSPFGGEIAWNFEKFLLGRDGAVLARFKPGTEPDAEAVIKAIEKALAVPVAGEDWKALRVNGVSGVASF